MRCIGKIYAAKAVLIINEASLSWPQNKLFLKLEEIMDSLLLFIKIIKIILILLKFIKITFEINLILYEIYSTEYW